MIKNAVFCIAKDRTHAETIVEGLKTAGYPSTDISVLLPESSGTKEFAHEQNTKMPEGATTGVVAGMSTGAVLGWLAGIGTLAIPGVGPFIAAGPIMAALGGAAVGGATGGILGALVGMGIPEIEAKHYDGRISSGNTLISVQTAGTEQENSVRQIFESLGGEDIKSTKETLATN